ncbi:MAG: NUDIX hydrolase [Pseudomonadota bacterium]|nr:NUDIX hydrolase [Pseudomonadota bacterium]
MVDSTELLFSGDFLTLVRESVELPGNIRTRLEIIRHPGASAVLALDASARLCMLRQYRHAAGGWLWEIPAGKLDGAEDPQLAARRELEEETGYRADTWSSLGEIVPSPGFCDEVIHLFLARDLILGEVNREVDEVMEVHWLETEQLDAMVLDGRIRDAKTLAALYRFRLSGNT